MKAVTILVSAIALLVLVLSIFGPAVAAAEPADGSAPDVDLQQLPPCVGDDYTITVQHGERWTDIGMREHVGYEHLHRANPHGFTSGKVLIAGRHIALKSADNGIVINVPELTLFLFSDGQVSHWFPCSVGMVQPEWHTIIGDYSVFSKVVDPIWFQPPFAGGGSMPPGPANPLGDRAIYLDPITRMIAIHGTNDINTIGRMISHGCIRMFPPHVHELFELVSEGMPVVMTYQTIKVGQQNGTVFLAVFPDIYDKGTNSLAQAHAVLAQYHLSEAVTDAELQARLAHPDGIARPILGSATQVTMNGAPWHGPIGPSERDGRYYLPLTALSRAIGAKMAWDPHSKSARVDYHGKTVLFPLDGHTAFRALGTVFVPVRRFVTGFGGTVNPAGGKLSISLAK